MDSQFFVLYEALAAALMDAFDRMLNTVEYVDHVQTDLCQITLQCRIEFVRLNMSV